MNGRKANRREIIGAEDGTASGNRGREEGELFERDLEVKSIVNLSCCFFAENLW